MLFYYLLLISCISSYNLSNFCCCNVRLLCFNTIAVSYFMFVELPTPSMPALTFINIRSVNISWEFDYSAISAAQNVCFVIEYQNNTQYANVSSMICNHTFFVFPYLLRGEQYRFRIYATDGVTSTVSNWTFMFINGIEGIKH